MGCRRFRSALGEAATGTLPAERRRQLDEHLARCAECAERLGRLQRARARIHRALSESAAAEPSHEWLRGIERRLAVELDSGRPRISYGVLAAMATSLAVVIGVWVLHGRFADHSHPTPVASLARPMAPAKTAKPEASARAEVSAFPGSARPGSLARVAPQAASERGRRFFAAVKVVPEKEAVIRLYQLLQSGRIDPRSLLTPAETATEPMTIAPLRIKSLSVQPIDMGGDTSARPGQLSGTSGAIETGENKEITP